jgi:hypothetical protein
MMHETGVSRKSAIAYADNEKCGSGVHQRVREDNRVIPELDISLLLVDRAAMTNAAA